MLAIAGCHDELLYPEPPSNLTTANFYKSGKDMNMAVIGIYSRLQSRKATVYNAENSDFTFMELAGDNAYKGTWASLYEHVDNWEMSSTSVGMEFWWTQCYNGIFRTNNVIENIDNPDNYQAGEREQYLGEAKFLRAMFYFDLVRVYGGVPKIDRPVTIAESKEIPRASEGEIYSLIVEDLTEAVNLLPDFIAYGRASKGAATALLGKVYVYLKDWTNAKTYLEKVLSDFNYELLSDFNAVHKTEDHKEMIFVVKYQPGSYGQFYSVQGLPYTGVYGVVQNGGNICPSWDLIKRFDPEDTRKAATIGEDWKPFDAKESDPVQWVPHIVKFYVPSLMNISPVVACGLDLPVLRLGDIILLYAETLYELNQPQQALTQLNRIRERAFQGDSHNYTMADIPNKNAWIAKLHLERRFELCFEYERWFDLVRSGLYMNLTEYETFNDGKGVILKKTLVPQTWKKYFPIPQSQIDQYPKGFLVQNEGYD